MVVAMLVFAVFAAVANRGQRYGTCVPVIYPAELPHRTDNVGSNVASLLFTRLNPTEPTLSVL